MLTIASRGSQLALWQARRVADVLAARGRECRIEIVRATGGRNDARGGRDSRDISLPGPIAC